MLVKKAPRYCLALLYSSLVWSCDNGRDLPNDPLPAIVCDNGYILSFDGTGCVPAGSVVVHGVVTDRVSGLPISGVAVVVHPLRTTTTETDSTGYFNVTGGQTTDDIIVTYIHANYVFAARTITGEDEGLESDVGAFVLDASQTLVPLGRTIRVAGTVYAGDSIASGATVLLTKEGDDGATYVAYEVVTNASGKFAIDGVHTDTYSLVVLPFDQDGDLIIDYGLYSTAPIDFATGVGVSDEAPLYFNTSNLVVSLAPVAHRIEYISLIDCESPLANAANSTYVTVSGCRLIDPTASVLMHFSAAVAIDTVRIELHPISVNSFANDEIVAYGDRIDFSASWSTDHTTLTLDPTVPLPADADPTTRLALTIRALLWQDGAALVAPTNPNAAFEYRFDVEKAPELLSSPLPRLLFSRRQSYADASGQVAATDALPYSCDAMGCWILAADGYPIGGFGTLATTNTIRGAFNSILGFDLAWAHVSGAASYHAYVRRRSAGGADATWSNWYPTNIALDVAPTDPGFTGIVNASILTGSVNTLTDDACWDDFNTLDSLGALGGGADIDIAVTAVDARGFESAIVPSTAITLSDTWPTTAMSWVVAAGATQDLGSNGVDKAISVTFSEPMSTSTNPVLSASSGNIVSFRALGSPVWVRSVPSPENTAATFSDTYHLGIRGGCAQTTSGALASNTTNPNITVKDAERFAVGMPVFFIAANDAGAGATTSVSVSQITDNTLYFSTAAPRDIPSDGSWLVCARNVAGGTTTVSDVSAGASTTELEVGDASIFSSGSLVLVYHVGDPSRSVTVKATVRTVVGGISASNILELDTVLAPVSYAAADLVVMPWYGASEYALRNATTMLRPRVDALATADSVQLPFTGDTAFLASNIMPQDLCLVDLDGVANTVDDRYFGHVVEVTRQIGTTPEAHLTLAPPTGVGPAIAEGTTIRGGVAFVVCMGDSLSIANETGTSALVDTSGNLGLTAFGDQYAACSDAAPPCGVMSAGALVY